MQLSLPQPPKSCNNKSKRRKKIICQHVNSFSAVVETIMPTQKMAGPIAK